MTPTRTLRNTAMTLLAANAGTLAPAVDGNLLKLAQNDFAPAESTVLADIDEADFPGYAAIECTPGTQPEGFEPATDASRINISPPVGGFIWETNAAVDPAQTIYGFYLTSNDGLTLLATARFDTPVVLTVANQIVEVDDAHLSLAANAIS